MKEIKIGVAIMVNNMAELLPACISSVNWTDGIFILDDHCTDESIEVIKKYCKTNLIVEKSPFMETAFIHDETEVRNHIIRRAFATLEIDAIIILDADEMICDLIKPTIISAFTENQFNSISINIWHMYNLKKYIHIWETNINGVAMVDPHIRIIKKDIYYESRFTDGSHPGIKYTDKTLCVNGPYHFHLKYFHKFSLANYSIHFLPKFIQFKDIRSFLKEYNFSLPTEIKKCLKLIKIIPSNKDFKHHEELRTKTISAEEALIHPRDRTKIENAFFINFSGLGNGVTIMPLILYLIKENKFNKIYCTSNRLIEDEFILNDLGIYNKLIPVEPLLRRFNKNNWDLIYIYLKAKNIKHIFNFRNENLEEYELFKLQYPEFIYHDFDYKSLVVRDYKKLVFQDIFDLFTDTGFINSKNNSEWLKKYRVAKNIEFTGKNKIGFMISSSQSNKELHLEKWIELANLLFKNYSNLQINIFSGIREQEIEKAKKIVHEIDNKNCVYIKSNSLIETFSEIGKMDLFISNDTGLIHVASAMGIPVIGVYTSTDPLIWGPNNFEKFKYVQSNTIGKCNHWKPYAGNCGHFYEICEEFKKEDIKPLNILLTLLNF